MWGDVMNVVVVGGGKVGYYLTKTLLSKGHDVSLIEKSEERCRRIVEEFDILTINGDGTNIYDLADAGTDRADVVAAVTGSDEENLVVCQMAKRKFGVPRTVARINNPKNERVFKELGVDVAVSSTSIIASFIEHEMAKGAIKTLLTFDRNDMAIVEADIDDESPAIQKSVRQLVLPQNSVLAAIIRQGRIIFPRGDTIIESGDAIIALTTEDHKDELRDILLGKRKRM